MIIENVAQGSAEWKHVRLGIPTSSNFNKIITIKGEPSKQKQKYMYQLAAERITGVKEDTYTNAIMERGIMIEAEARNIYEFITENEVEQIGFCYHSDKKLWGCSPDGLIGKDGVLELKSPLSHTHVGYLLSGKLPTDYFPQTQGQILVTGRKYVDFFSFYPGMKPLLIKVEPNKKFIEALKRELELFCGELDEITERLREK